MVYRTRRYLWQSCIAILFVVMLSACGQSAPGSAQQQEAETGNESAAANVGEKAGTRVYTDALGREVTIPAHPERVLTTQYLPEMLAIGMKPAGAATHLLTGFASIKDQIGGIEDIGAANALDLEKALALEPDLIIANEYNKDQLDQLNKIAPTVVVQWEGQDAFEHFKAVADVLGQSDKADEWIQNFDKRAEDVRAELSAYVDDKETFGVVVIGGYEKGQLRVYGSGNVGYTLFDALKFPMTDMVKQEWEKGNHEAGVSISMEKLPEYASADRLFVVKFDNDPDFVKEVDDSSLWRNLPAVKNGKVYVVDDGLWFSYDVMSLKAQLEDAIRLLSK